MLTRALVVLGGLALTGCAALGGGPVHAGLKGRFVDEGSVRAASAEVQAPVSAGQAMGVRNNLGGAKDEVRSNLAGNVLLDGPLPPSETSRYLERIRDKLLAGWPHTQPMVPPRVEVTLNEAYSAEGSADGKIRITQGLLERAGSEDELAFVVGHELGHLLLHHQVRRDQQMHQAENLIRMTAMLVSVGAVIAGGRSGVSQAVQHGARVAVLAAAGGELGLAETLTTLVNPGWSRRQEEEADLVGIDLMVAAGYNPRYVSAVLEAVEAAETDAMVKVARVQPAVAAGPPGPINVSALLTRALTNLRSDLRTDHPETKDRDTFVTEYRGRMHQEATERAKSMRDLKRVKDSARYREMRAAVKLAYAADEARSQGNGRRSLLLAQDVRRKLPGWWGGPYLVGLAQIDLGQQQVAMAALSQAAEMPGAPFGVYERIAAERAQSGDVAGAIAVLDRAAQRFNDVELTLPDRITIHRNGGNAAEVQRVLQRCNTSGNPRLRDSCSAAANPPKVT